jgi:hypothetical protein
LFASFESRPVPYTLSFCTLLEYRIWAGLTRRFMPVYSSAFAISRVPHLARVNSPVHASLLLFFCILSEYRTRVGLTHRLMPVTLLHLLAAFSRGPHLSRVNTSAHASSHPLFLPSSLLNTPYAMGRSSPPPSYHLIVHAILPTLTP